MPPVYRFRNPAGVITDITSYFRLYDLDVSTNAEEGSVNQSTVTADDPTGAFDIVGHRIFEVLEDTATSSNTQIYVGYTAARRIHRGESTKTAAARVWDIDLVDLNSVLSRRVMTGTDANRPAETDVERVRWLLSTNEAAIIDDSLYFDTSGAVPMDAADYRGQKFNQVLDDCAQASGKNYFVWSRQETGEFSLWYDFAGSTSYSSMIKLTNVLSEVDNDLTFAISADTEFARSPDRVYSGAYLPYDGGAVFQQDVTTANDFARRDAIMPSENVKSAAKATARANRYLGTMDTEEDVITTTVQLPAAKVNFLMQGMRVQIKASHLPGYESAYLWARVLNRSVRQVSEENYDVKLELASAEPFDQCKPAWAAGAAPDGPEADAIAGYGNVPWFGGTWTRYNPNGVTMTDGSGMYNIGPPQDSAGATGAPGVGFLFVYGWDCDRGVGADSLARLYTNTDQGAADGGDGTGHSIWYSDDGVTYTELFSIADYAAAWDAAANLAVFQIPRAHRDHRYWRFLITDLFEGGFWEGLYVGGWGMDPCA